MTRRLRLLVSTSALRCTAALCVAAFAASSAHGYSEGTHEAISNVAVNRPDCKVDEYLKQQLVLPDGINTMAGGVTLVRRLEQGARDEDSGQRPLNHFYNPINNRGLYDLSSGAPSLVWAYDHADNQYDWRGTRDAYYRSFTSGSKAQRTTEMGNTFFSLGHVVHLVQDLAQPQHTRNDAHLTAFGIALPGAPYEAYCLAHYGAPGNFGTLSTAGIPSFANATTTLEGIPGSFAGYWDTDQYTGQAGFTTFGSTPGLAEFSNANFITDDTMFGTFRTGFLRRPGMPGLRVRLTESIGNNSTDAKHAFPHPSLFNTDLASFYPAATTRVDLQREGEDLAGAVHYISLTVRDATGTVVRTMPNLFMVNHNTFFDDEIGFDATCYQTWAETLLPQAVAYSAGLMNYFFRGKIDIQVRWQNAAGQYRITITNRSGETMGAGTWELYQDDASDARSAIAASFSYPGSLADGASFTADFAATSREGRYALVFHGTLGNEPDNAVVAKEFEIVRVHITWTPRSDQDLMMWGPDGSIIWWNNLITQHGELDNDNIGGLGPENITLKDLQPGTYQFMINYYRDWWKEQFYDSGTSTCIPYGSPVNAPDDYPPYISNPCFVQTPITVTMHTFHNSSTPVRTETRTLNLPSYAYGAPGPGYPEGPVGDEWYITQIVTVDDQRHVSIGGTGPQPVPLEASRIARKADNWNPPRKAEGRQP